MSEETQQIINFSITSGTTSQYSTTYKRWIEYCTENSIQCFNASIEEGLEFLTHIFKKFNLQYSAMNSARSALSLIIPRQGTTTFGNTDIVTRYMKGIFKLKPSLGKYTCIYDADIVIKYLDTINNNTAPLKELSHKLLMILLLVTSQRNQSMASININTIHISHTMDIVDIFVPDVLKTTKAGRHLQAMRLSSFRPNPNICPVETLKIYMNKTKDLRTDEALFISYIQPHKGVKVTSLSRWAKSTLLKAGINIDIYSAHSTRAASSSKKLTLNVSTEDIRKAAGWTNLSTFGRFYNKPITQ